MSTARENSKMRNSNGTEDGRRLMTYKDKLLGFNGENSEDPDEDEHMETGDQTEGDDDMENHTDPINQ